MVAAFLLWVMCCIGQPPWAEASSPLPLLWPKTDSIQASALRAGTRQEEPYVTRRGEVHLGGIDQFMDTLSLTANPKSRPSAYIGKTFTLSFFPGKEISVVVDAARRSRDSLLNLAGYEVNTAISTFTMTMSRERFLISYQDLNSGMLYRVIGSLATGVGSATEIDQANIPPSYDQTLALPEDEHLPD